MKQESSVFIKLLEYGEAVGLDGTTPNDLREWAVKENVIPAKKDPNFKKQSALLSKLFSECFSVESILLDNGSKVLRVLKTEYYFRLLEHRELEEARTAAKLANRNAIWAIIISVIAVILTLLASYLQLNDSVLIDSDQFNQLLRTVIEH